MFNQIVASTLDAATVPVPPSSILPIDSGAAWALILAVLGFSTAILWLLRDTPARPEKPREQPPSYRKAA